MPGTYSPFSFFLTIYGGHYFWRTGMIYLCLAALDLKPVALN
jgi:hypothetical protein